jgi:hypothetical protein
MAAAYLNLSGEDFSHYVFHGKGGPKLSGKQLYCHFYTSKGYAIYIDYFTRKS